ELTSRGGRRGRSMCKAMIGMANRPSSSPAGEARLTTDPRPFWRSLPPLWGRNPPPKPPSSQDSGAAPGAEHQWLQVVIGQHAYIRGAGLVTFLGHAVGPRRRQPAILGDRARRQRDLHPLAALLVDQFDVAGGLGRQ